jgi:hypothetical protein
MKRNSGLYSPLVVCDASQLGHCPFQTPPRHWHHSPSSYSPSLIRDRLTGECIQRTADDKGTRRRTIALQKIVGSVVLRAVDGRECWRLSAMAGAALHAASYVGRRVFFGLGPLLGVIEATR